MNERIRELAKKADIDIRHIENHADEDFQQCLEEFAELIVKECNTQIVQYQSRVYANKEHLVSERLEQLRGLIKYHFGVKE